MNYIMRVPDKFTFLFTTRIILVDYKIIPNPWGISEKFIGFLQNQSLLWNVVNKD